MAGNSRAVAGGAVAGGAIAGGAERRRTASQRRLAYLLAVVSTAAAACGGATRSAAPTGAAAEGDCPPGEFFWEIPDCDPEALVDVGDVIPGGPPPDGIPPIDRPRFESVAQAARWLKPQSPLLVVSINRDVRGYPLAIMTRHEIANDTVGGVPVAVTYCPLCNSGLVFARTVGQRVLDFGTSGRLYRSNLVMYDRQTKNLWVQFTGQAVVGQPHLGTRLERIPSSILSFEEFRAAAPDGRVLSRDTGHAGRYGRNPYVGYEGRDPRGFLYEGPTDPRLPLMARVVGLGAGKDPVAVNLAELRRRRVLTLAVADQPIVVLWSPGTASALDTAEIDEGRDVGSTAAFRPLANDRRLTFRPAGDDTFADEQTGSTWNLLGEAVAGPLRGSRLEPVHHDDTFWFVWFAFQPNTRVLPAPTPAPTPAR